MLQKRKMLFAIPLATTLIACVPSTTETVRTISNYCLIAKPITYSAIKPGQVETEENKYDTTETTVQIVEHDLVFERLCPKEKT